jgi:Uma2 family endonuclease
VNGMATIMQTLTYAEFRSQYSQSERGFEYWYGAAMPQGTPTWIHGLLQKIVMKLLDDAGFKSGSEIELRIDAKAHPKPDVIATTGPVELPYPTKALDVVVEILSEDDSMIYLRSKCRAYQKWGFKHIYLIDPNDRAVLEWIDGSLLVRGNFTSVPVDRIWSALDEQIDANR